MGDSGLLTLPLSPTGEKFNNIPNYIGSNSPNAEMKLKIKLQKKQIGQYLFNIGGMQCDEEQVIMTLSNGSYFIPGKGYN